MDQIVKNLPFEVVALPQDVVPNSTLNVPVKVKIRMKKTDKGHIVRQGLIAVPKMKTTHSEKTRMVNSDETIISFNIQIEPETEAKPPRKSQNKFFHLFKTGKCLDVSEDYNDPPYMIGTAKTNEVEPERSLSESNDKRKSIKTLQNKYSTESPVVIFGKCKPGGCLDPPFGEDNYQYQPKLKQKFKSKEEKKFQKLRRKRLKEDIKKEKDAETAAVKNADEIIVSSTCMLHRANSNSSLLNEKHSDSIITYPARTSSGDISIFEKSVTSRKSSVVKNKQLNVDYFTPPVNLKKSNERNKELLNKKKIDEVKTNSRSSNSNISRIGNKSELSTILQDSTNIDNKVIVNKTSQESVPTLDHELLKLFDVYDNTKELISPCQTKSDKIKIKSKLDEVKESVNNYSETSIRDISEFVNEKTTDDVKTDEKLPKISLDLSTVNQNIISNETLLFKIPTTENNEIPNILNEFSNNELKIHEEYRKNVGNLLNADIAAREREQEKESPLQLSTIFKLNNRIDECASKSSCNINEEKPASIDMNLMKSNLKNAGKIDDCEYVPNLEKLTDQFFNISSGFPDVEKVNKNMLQIYKDIDSKKTEESTVYSDNLSKDHIIDKGSLTKYPVTSEFKEKISLGDKLISLKTSMIEGTQSIEESNKNKILVIDNTNSFNETKKKATLRTSIESDSILDDEPTSKKLVSSVHKNNTTAKLQVSIDKEDVLKDESIFKNMLSDVSLNVDKTNPETKNVTSIQEQEDKHQEIQQNDIPFYNNLIPIDLPTNSSLDKINLQTQCKKSADSDDVLKDESVFNNVLPDVPFNKDQIKLETNYKESNYEQNTQDNKSFVEKMIPIDLQLTSSVDKTNIKTKLTTSVDSEDIFKDESKLHNVHSVVSFNLDEAKPDTKNETTIQERNDQHKDMSLPNYMMTVNLPVNSSSDKINLKIEQKIPMDSNNLLNNEYLYNDSPIDLSINTEKKSIDSALTKNGTTLPTANMGSTRSHNTLPKIVITTDGDIREMGKTTLSEQYLQIEKMLSHEKMFNSVPPQYIIPTSSESNMPIVDLLKIEKLSVTNGDAKIFVTNTQETTEEEKREDEITNQKNAHLTKHTLRNTLSTDSVRGDGYYHKTNKREDASKNVQEISHYKIHQGFNAKVNHPNIAEQVTLSNNPVTSLQYQTNNTKENYVSNNSSPIGSGKETLKQSNLNMPYSTEQNLYTSSSNLSLRFDNNNLSPVIVENKKTNSNTSNVDATGRKELYELQQNIPDVNNYHGSSEAMKISKEINVNRTIKDFKLLNNITDNFKPVSKSSLESVSKKTIMVDLAFQTYINENAESVLKTYDASGETKRFSHDKVFLIKSALKLNESELSFAINSDTRLSIKVHNNNKNMNNSLQRVFKTEGGKSTDNYIFTQRMNRNSKIHMVDSNAAPLYESLSDIYEEDLVPIENLIKNLRLEIERIIKYRHLMRNKTAAVTKKLKPIHKRCYCNKNWKN